MKYVLNNLFIIFLYIVFMEVLVFNDLALFNQKIMTKEGDSCSKLGWL